MTSSSTRSGVRMASSARNSERSNKQHQQFEDRRVAVPQFEERRPRAVSADEAVQPRHHAVGIGERERGLR